MKNQKGFIQIILILVIVVLVGGGMYYFGKMSNKSGVVIETPTSIPTSSETSVKEETANWKTYTNKSLGFEIKYPPSVKIDKELNDQNNRATIFKDGSLNFEVMLRDSRNIDLENYYYMDDIYDKRSLLGGLTSNVYTYDASKNSCVSGNGPPCPVSYVVYVAQKDGDLYHLSFYGDDVLSDIETKILSTFKFTQ